MTARAYYAWGLVIALLLLAPVPGDADEKSAKAERPKAEEKPKADEAKTTEKKEASLGIEQIRPRGTPGSRTGGGTRGGTDLPTILLLAPRDLPDVGLTSRAQPTLSWYLSAATKTRIDVTLVDEKSILPLLEITVATPVSPGIHALRLSDYGISFETAKTYHWFVALVPDPIRRSNDVVAGAAIRRASMPPEAHPRLASSEARPSPEILAEHGFWYDALADVSDAIAAKPSDASLRRERAALLESVGFEVSSAAAAR